MMISMIYCFLHSIFFICSLPKALYHMAVHKKYRGSIIQRFGFGVAQLDKNAPVYWVHAVSVGETVAAVPLIEKIMKNDPTAHVVISSITETGHETAKKLLPHCIHLFLPFDFSWTTRRVLSKIAPDVVILVEGDFWYRFLHIAKRQGAVIVVVNGKMSATSAKRYSYLACFSKKLFSLVDLFMVQNEVYKKRFQSLHIPSSKLKVTGNLKGDRLPAQLTEEEKRHFAISYRIDPSDYVIVVGSSHEPEEEKIAAELKPLLMRYPQLKLMIVPRHVERAPHISQLMQKMNLADRVVVVDRMGVLTKCYQLADIAIVAGSFVSHVGGHNILEPAMYNVAVLCGPYMHAQPELIESALAVNGCLQLRIEDLSTTIEKLILDPSMKQGFCKRGCDFVKSHQGATEKTFSYIHSVVPQFFHEKR